MHCILRMLLVCIRSNVKQFLRYNFLILNTCNPDIVFALARIARICGYFSKPKGTHEQKS